MRIRTIVLLLVCVLVASFFGSLMGLSSLRSGSNSNGNFLSFLLKGIMPTSAISEEKSQYETRNDLPSCDGNAVLTRSPADSGTFEHILPLGNISANNGDSSHVVPTDHIYFTHSMTNTPITSQAQAETQGETIPVFAPADIQILEVDEKAYIDPSQNITKSDYSIYFSPCKDVVFYFHHITDLNPVITNAINHDNNSANQCFTGQTGTTTVKTCNYFNMTQKLSAGDKIGLGSFDFGMYDYRQKPANFVDQPKATTVWAACPLDYFVEPIKAQLYKTILNTKLNASGLPDCGLYMQDKAGTIQGNWYLPNTNNQDQGGAQDNNELAVVHSNTDPSLGVIAWGSVFAPANQLHFQPTTNGLVNREPSQVTADGQVYCYQGPLGLINANGKIAPLTQLDGYVVLQLVDGKTLKAEYGQGACPTNPNFSNPTTYVR